MTLATIILLTFGFLFLFGIFVSTIAASIFLQDIKELLEKHFADDEIKRGN